MTDGN